MSPLLVLAGGAALAAAASPMLLLGAVARREKLTQRLAAFGRGLDGPATRTAADRATDRAVRAVTAIGTAIARSGLLSAATLVQLEQTLLAAGLRGANGLGLFVGSKLLLLGLLPVVAWTGAQWFGLASSGRIAAVAGAGIVGLLAPDYAVRSIRHALLARVSAGLPDALDLMVICSEAGLGLEPALARVAAEIGLAHPAVAEELAATASELRVASDRRQALLGMGARTGLESLKRLGATLVQTMQYGTPLSQALRTLSVEMRGEMLTAFEARAARLPVLLTLPMIVFILPTVFMIVGGPAMLSVAASLRK